MDGILVNHGALDGIVADLTRGVAEIDGRLDRLEAELAPLRADWHGDAQAAYAVAKQRWDTAIREMAELLQQTGRTVAASNESYRAADAHGARLFGG